MSENNSKRGRIPAAAYCLKNEVPFTADFNVYGPETIKAILDAMRKAGVPLNAGKVAELTGLDRKVVDKAFEAMKKDGSIVSPVRFKWEPAEK